MTTSHFKDTVCTNEEAEVRSASGVGDPEGVGGSGGVLGARLVGVSASGVEDPEGVGGSGGVLGDGAKLIGVLSLLSPMRNVKGMTEYQYECPCIVFPSLL